MFKNLFGGDLSTTIILIVIVLAVIIFAIVSSIVGKKTQRIEREKRKKQVKDKIKQYIKENDNRKNLRIEYEKVVARRGKEYKYRDIFDVIVTIYEAKTNEMVAEKAYEIEGVSKKVSKKQYETNWVVNREIDLEETKKRIAISEKKIKLTKEEKKLEKLRVQKEVEQQRKEMIEKRKAEKELKKQGKLESITEDRPKPKAEKFNPRQN